MNKQEIRKKVDEFDLLQKWNHNFHLPFGVETRPGEQTSHGKNLVKFDRLLPIFDEIGVDGKRVLDVGCNEGFFSLSLRDWRRGIGRKPTSWLPQPCHRRAGAHNAPRTLWPDPYKIPG